MNASSLKFTPPPGLIITGKVTGTVDDSSNRIPLSISLGGKKNSQYDFYYTYSDNNGVLIGAKPPPNTPALILQGQSSQYVPIKYYATNHGILPQNLVPGQLLLRSNPENNILLRQNDIILGKSENKRLLLYNGEYASDNWYDSYNNNYNYHFNFSQSSRKIDGEIRREIGETNYPDSLKLIKEDFYRNIPSISLFSFDDFNSTELNEFVSLKSPNFTENREIVYEFSYSSNVLDLKSESENYLSSSEKASKSSTLPTLKKDRRASRADTLSLGLTSPNYLMESVKGTVVDIYGNLLDLNRFPIKNKLNGDLQSSQADNYFKIRENQRRGIAFHFEINAKKDLGKLNNPPDVNDTSDYARSRSRFFVDVDKEGQFKINIPASSESGNVPLLTRYENYNTVAAANDPSINPNELLFPSDAVDVLHDSFAAGMVNFNLKYESKKDQIKSKGGYNRGLISIKDKDGAEVSPIDRISKKITDGNNVSHLAHGTAYHDITATCISHQLPDLTNYLYNPPETLIFPNQVITHPIVSESIIVGKNAGGRSGSINLDGSIELNVGANTIDRQSIWLDTAGGMIANIGKDKNNISAAIGMDGQLLLQVGGFGINESQDSRFDSKGINNAYTSGAIDIRVITEGNNATVIRIDKTGISLISPTKIFIESNGEIDIRSNSKVSISGEIVEIEGRRVEKIAQSLNPTI